MSKLKKNILYNTGYQLLVIIIPLITSPYLSRVLGTEGVGVYSYTYSVANYFVLFSMLGLSNYGNRSIAAVKDDLEKRSRLFNSIFLMQLVWAGIICISYLVYILLFVNIYREIAVIQIIYVASAILDINWFYFGMEEFKLTVVRNFCIKIVTLVCIFTFVKTKYDVGKYTMIMAAGMLISQSWVWVYLHRYVKYVKVSVRDVISHIRPNFILFIPVISYSIYKLMDKIMLGNMTSVSSVGIYEYAEKIINIPMGFVSAFGTVMLPRVSNLAAKNDQKRINFYTQSSMKYISIIACAMAFGLIAVGSVFAPLYYGEQFTQSGTIIEMLAITILFVSWANIIRTQYLIPFGRDRVYLASTVIGAILNLAVNLLLIPYYGCYGAAMGTIIAEFSVALVQIIGTRYEFDYKTLFKETRPAFIIAIIMCIITKYVGSVMKPGFMKLFVMFLVGMITYTGLSFIYFVLIKKDDVICGLLKKIGSK